MERKKHYILNLNYEKELWLRILQDRNFTMINNLHNYIPNESILVEKWK